MITLELTSVLYQFILSGFEDLWPFNFPLLVTIIMAASCTSGQAGVCVCVCVVVVVA